MVWDLELKAESMMSKRSRQSQAILTVFFSAPKAEAPFKITIMIIFCIV